MTQIIHVKTLEEASAITDDIVALLRASQSAASLVRDAAASRVKVHRRALSASASAVNPWLDGTHIQAPAGTSPGVVGVASDIGGMDPYNMFYAAGLCGTTAAVQSGSVVRRSLSGAATFSMLDAGAICFTCPISGSNSTMRVMVRGTVDITTEPFAYKGTRGNGVIRFNRFRTTAPSCSSMGLGDACRLASCRLYATAPTLRPALADLTRTSGIGENGVTMLAQTSTAAAASNHLLTLGRYAPIGNVHSVVGYSGATIPGYAEQVALSESDIWASINSSDMPSWWGQWGKYGYWWCISDAASQVRKQLEGYNWFVSDRYWLVGYDPIRYPSDFVTRVWDDDKGWLYGVPREIKVWQVAANMKTTTLPTMVTAEIIDSNTVAFDVSVPANVNGAAAIRFATWAVGWTDRNPYKVKVSASGSWANGASLAGVTSSLVSASVSELHAELPPIAGGVLRREDYE